jgi:hypothetical protein
MLNGSLTVFEKASGGVKCPSQAQHCDARREPMMFAYFFAERKSWD